MVVTHLFGVLCLLALPQTIAQSYSGEPSKNDASARSPPESTTHNPTPAEDRYYNNIIIAHAVFACLAWSLLAPLGAIIIRAMNSRWTFALHTSIQLGVVFFFVISVGLGIRISIRLQTFLDIWTDPHVVLGLCILGLALVNPLLGYIHHAIFIRRRAAGSKATSRTLWTHVHLWLGRCLILAGMINGGLGFRLGLDSPKQNHNTVKIGVLVYSCVSVAMAVGWAVAAVWGEWRGRTQTNAKIEGQSEDGHGKGKWKREGDSRRGSWDPWSEEKGPARTEDGGESSEYGRRTYQRPQYFNVVKDPTKGPRVVPVA